MSYSTRLAAVAAGIVLDRVVPEPANRYHPTARFGQLMNVVEDRIWAPTRSRGALHAAIGATVGMTAGRLVGTLPMVLASTAGNQLRSVATEIATLLGDPDPEPARAAMQWLVGRNPSELDHQAMASAVIESLAENSVDAMIAPIVWGALAGGAGAGMHRALNTMDAMIGHRSDRYARYGTAAARADDVANYLPARVFALLVVIARPRRATAILNAIRTSASAHPSPNAGIAEAAVAGAIGRQLGGPLRYGDRFEDRPLLGGGPRPEPSDIETAVHLTRQVEGLAIAALVVLSLTGMRRPGR